MSALGMLNKSVLKHLKHDHNENSKLKTYHPPSFFFQSKLLQKSNKSRGIINLPTTNQGHSTIKANFLQISVPDDDGRRDEL